MTANGTVRRSSDEVAAWRLELIRQELRLLDALRLAEDFGPVGEALDLDVRQALARLRMQYGGGTR